MDVDREAPGLARAVAGIGSSPRMMSIASDIAVGEPLVRQVGGRWVGTLMSPWINVYVHRIDPNPGKRSPLAVDLAFEERVLASDIRDRHPDAVLADAEDFDRWVADKPAIAAALDDYRPVGTYGSVALWERKPDR